MGSNIVEQHWGVLLRNNSVCFAQTAALQLRGCAAALLLLRAAAALLLRYCCCCAAACCCWLLRCC